MALVAYENSDSSDYEEEGNSDSTIAVFNNKTEIKHDPDPAVLKHVKTIEDEQEPEPQKNEQSLFNFLPQPSKQKPAVIEEDDEFLHKKETTNFKDVKDSPIIVKSRVPADKKSGLLSMLPQPRNGVKSTTVSLIPQVLKKKPEIPVKKVPLPTPPKKCKVDSTPLVSEYSDESDSEDLQNDFFSIHKPVELPDAVQLPLDIDHNTKKHDKHQGIESFFKKEEDMKHVVLEPDYDQSVEEQAAGGSSYDAAAYGAEGSNNDVLLNEEAAKANEAELQNQWANNRMSKRQTQAKYGF
ncbi:hypothetical protein HF086_006617 [Spodoptera exigua]|uniref:Proline-rich protein PRCC n=1 Tax=Spodoptera exigua TaxID=7107 RepID=A0A922SBP5_SPOEX|nr:hypothetical protein HF086_006617 [Spodoptera exigua]